MSQVAIELTLSFVSAFWSIWLSTRWSFWSRAVDQSFRFPRAENGTAPGFPEHSLRTHGDATAHFSSSARGSEITLGWSSSSDSGETSKNHLFQRVYCNLVSSSQLAISSCFFDIRNVVFHTWVDRTPMCTRQGASS